MTYTESKSYLTEKQMDKKLKSITDNTVKCKECGHSIVMPRADRTICSWCGLWVYRTPQIEFKYKLNKQMKENK